MWWAALTALYLLFMRLAGNRSGICSKQGLGKYNWIKTLFTSAIEGDRAKKRIFCLSYSTDEAYNMEGEWVGGWVGGWGFKSQRVKISINKKINSKMHFCSGIPARMLKDQVHNIPTGIITQSWHYPWFSTDHWWFRWLKYGYFATSKQYPGK